MAKVEAEVVAAKDLGIADRNFGTTCSLFGIAQRGRSFVIRQHASTLHYVMKPRPLAV